MGCGLATVKYNVDEGRIGAVVNVIGAATSGGRRFAVRGRRTRSTSHCCLNPYNHLWLPWVPMDTCGYLWVVVKIFT
jgi:hypothetical protein